MMTSRLYDDYVAKLSRRFDKALSEIEAGHNFDYGDEFEIALCKVLRLVIPFDFGICRGYVVDAVGDKAGDDIIVFDRARFPTLRALGEENYAQKEKVPIEAVYAYIEAKHTLHLDGTGAASVRHACQQVARVKELCSQREPVPPGQISPYWNVGAFAPKPPKNWPNHMNPMFAAIFARRCMLASKVTNDPDQIKDCLAGELRNANVAPAPDLIVAGPLNVSVPLVVTDSEHPWIWESPFYIPGRSRLNTMKVDGIAFGIGLSSLLYALDWIQLGKMQWGRIFCDALGIRMVP